MLNLIQKYKGSTYVKQILVLLSGSVMAQLLPMAFSPILSRLYTPNHFGLLALYSSFTSTISIISTGRYEFALMIPRDKKEAIYLFRLSVYILFVIFLLTLASVLLFRTEISLLIGDVRLANWLLLAPFSILVLGIFQITTFFFNRLKRYKAISFSRVIQSSGICASQTGFSFIDTNGLILGGFLGRFLATIYVSYRLLGIVSLKTLFKDLDLNELLNTAKAYKEYPLVNTFHAVTDLARDNVSFILIANYFGAEVLGLYAVSVRLLKAPIMFIGSAVGQVFYKEAVSFQDKGQLFKQSFSLVKKAALMGLPIFILLYIFAEDIFAIFLGDKWSDSGNYAHILTLLFYFNFISAPIGSLTFILKKQLFFFYINIFKTASFIGIVFYFGSYGFKFTDALFAINLVIAGINLVIITLLLYFTKESDSKIKTEG